MTTEINAIHNDVWWNLAGEYPVHVLEIDDLVRWHTYDAAHTVQRTEALTFIQSHLPMYVAQL